METHRINMIRQSWPIPYVAVKDHEWFKLVTGYRVNGSTYNEMPNIGAACKVVVTNAARTLQKFSKHPQVVLLRFCLVIRIKGRCCRPFVRIRAA
eukprot:SAG11_NODE_2675_length_3106_cov_2.195211_6_plen_95_part_00